MHLDQDRPIGRPNTWVQQQERSILWLWEGVIVQEAVTLLSAPEKTGKTTLVSLLLDRRRRGGHLLGRAVQPGKTLLCSEDHERLWTLRQPPLDFGPELIFHHPPGPSPTRGRWKRFLDDVFDLALRDDPIDLLVIDTAVTFLPLFGRNKQLLRWALARLRDLTTVPAGVLIVNQSRNVHRPLAAFADIVLEMTIPRGPTPTRRRTFTAVGRYPDTLQTATAELNAEGTDYLLLPDSPLPHPPLLPTLQTLLASSPTPLTRNELLARWPGSAPRPDTLWRTLTRGVQCGLFVATGAGTRTDPLRYGLANPTAQAEVTTGEQQAPGTA
jgi:hypothetical protein